LLLIPKTIWLVASLAIDIMAGAIIMHLTQLGIDVKGDGGILFYTALVTFILSAVISFSEKRNISLINNN
jgi:putative oxidoreductase